MKKGDVRICGCGKEFIIKSYAHKYCDACAKDRKREKTALWIRSNAKQILTEKINNGTATRINEEKLCDCGEKFLARSYTHKYCDNCAADKRKLVQKEYYLSHRKQFLKSLVKCQSKGCKKHYRPREDGKIHLYCSDRCRWRESARRRRAEKESAGLCSLCGGAWSEPVSTHRGKPNYCRMCQDYFKKRYKERR